MDPPTSDTSSVPSISLSSRQLEILAQRQQKQEPSQAVPPRDPSVLVTGPNRLDIDPRSVRLSLSSTFDNEHQRFGTPVRTRNPVSRDSSSGLRTETPQYISRILEKASSAAINNLGGSTSGDPLDAVKHTLAQKMIRNKQVGSSFGGSSSNSSMKRSDRVALTAAFRDRLRRGRKDEAKPPPQVSVTNVPYPTQSKDSNDKLVKGRDPEQGQVELKDDATTRTDDSNDLVRSSSFASQSGKLSLDHDTITKDATDSITEASDASEEEPEGYSDFIEILQAEVSGQHSQVCFQMRVTHAFFTQKSHF